MKNQSSKFKTQNNSSELKTRINKFLAQNGFGSRRGVEVLIREEKVKINNKIAKLSDRVDPNDDVVIVDEQVIKPKSEFIYYAANKPVGYTSTVRDEHAGKLVTELVPDDPRVYPVGRLDKNSRGLIILTNDGELANKLTHPRFEHEKEYEVKLKTQNSKFKSSFQNIKLQIQKLKKGIRLDEGLAKADKLEIINLDEKRNIAEIKIVLHQGWKRQIRRMCERAGLEVLDLKRVRIGKLELGDLDEGKYIAINKENIV